MPCALICGIPVVSSDYLEPGRGVEALMPRCPDTRYPCSRRGLAGLYAGRLIKKLWHCVLWPITSHRFGRLIACRQHAAREQRAREPSDVWRLASCILIRTIAAEYRHTADSSPARAPCLFGSVMSEQ